MRESCNPMKGEILQQRTFFVRRDDESEKNFFLKGMQEIEIMKTGMFMANVLRREVHGKNYQLNILNLSNGFKGKKTL